MTAPISLSTSMRTLMKITLLLWLHLSVIDASSAAARRNRSQRRAAKEANDEGTLFSSQRKACGFYVWNVVSAGLHGLCQHLCKDCKYEGLGGREFMLIPPGSLLQLVYPCDQYSPDSCLWCGGSHEDHVALAWSKKYLYTPFDLLLDRVKQDATSTQLIKVWKDVAPDVKTTYGFHKRYVIDIDSPPEKSVKSERLLMAQRRDDDDDGVTDNNTMEVKKMYGIRYLLPRFAIASPLFSRQIVMRQLNRMIEIQQFENEVLELKKHGEYSRRRARRIKERLQSLN